MPPGMPVNYSGQARKTSRVVGLKPGQSNYMPLNINTHFKGAAGVTGYHFDVVVGCCGVVDVTTSQGNFTFDPEYFEGKQIALELKGAPLDIEALGLIDEAWEFRVTALGAPKDG